MKTQNRIVRDIVAEKPSKPIAEKKKPVGLGQPKRQQPLGQTSVSTIYSISEHITEVIIPDPNTYTLLHTFNMGLLAYESASPNTVYINTIQKLYCNCSYALSFNQGGIDKVFLGGMCASSSYVLFNTQVVTMFFVDIEHYEGYPGGFTLFLRGRCVELPGTSYRNQYSPVLARHAFSYVDLFGVTYTAGLNFTIDLHLDAALTYTPNIT